MTAFERETLARIAREEVVQVRVAKGRFHRDLEGWQRFGAGAGLEGEAHEQCLMLRLGEDGEGSSLTSPEGRNGEGFANHVPLQVDAPRNTFRPRDL